MCWRQFLSVISSLLNPLNLCIIFYIQSWKQSLELEAPLLCSLKQFWASAIVFKATLHLNRLSPSVTFLIVTAQVPRALKADPNATAVSHSSWYDLRSQGKLPLVHSYCEHSPCSSKTCRWKSTLKLIRSFQRDLRAWQRNHNPCIQDINETKSNSAALEIETDYVVKNNNQKKHQKNPTKQNKIFKTLLTKTRLYTLQN